MVKNIKPNTNYKHQMVLYKAEFGLKICAYGS